jgi:hypothetical protein
LQDRLRSGFVDRRVDHDDILMSSLPAFGAIEFVGAERLFQGEREMIFAAFPQQKPDAPRLDNIGFGASDRYANGMRNE